MLNRNLYSRIVEYQEIFPVVAILGPRQCGKSTLAKMVISSDPEFLYLDLEKPSELNKLNDPELFFRNNLSKKICIDEIQLRPDLFNTMRSTIDENPVKGKFLILGSASRDLIKQSSETLAGRIGYLELAPFILSELEQTPNFNQNTHWIRGGFPDSVLQHSDHNSSIWRENFIRTFIERDVPQLGINIAPRTTRRLLTMCSHNQGQLLNSSRLGESLGVTYHTIQNYLDLLEQLFILRSLKPYSSNIKKRAIKAPKVYVRDSGILHSFLGIKDMNELLGHPIFGQSWEGYSLENILIHFHDWNPYFYRTSSGNEIDLILQNGNKKIAVEFKTSTAPKPTKGLYYVLDELKIEKSWIVAPIDEETYPLNERVTAISLPAFLNQEF